MRCQQPPIDLARALAPMANEYEIVRHESAKQMEMEGSILRRKTFSGQRHSSGVTLIHCVLCIIPDAATLSISIVCIVALQVNPRNGSKEG